MKKLIALVLILTGTLNLVGFSGTVSEENESKMYIKPAKLKSERIGIVRC